MLWLTSDTHFHHANIIHHQNRPFETVTEMDEILIKNWNKRCKPNDEIVIAGDLLYGRGQDANELLSKLNGRKHLVIGNHDHHFLDDKCFDRSLFVSIEHYFSRNIQVKGFKTKLVIFHYPIANWDGSHYGSIHGYGHIHNNEPNFELLGNAKRKFMFNISSDANNLTPVSVDELLIKHNRMQDFIDIRTGNKNLMETW